MSEVGQNEKVSQRAFLDRCTPESGRSFERGERQIRARLGHLARLFDHLVGERKQPIRHLDTQRLGGLEVHDQLDFRDLFDWQVTLPNRYVARLAEAASSSATDVGLFTARSARRRVRSPALPGDTHLSFSLLALGVPDFAPLCPPQLAVQSASAARQSFGTAYGMSLLSGGSWPMLHAINT
jgi:hypothetical protein